MKQACASVLDRPAPAMPEAEAVFTDRLTAQEFARLAAFVERYSGIKMPPTKKTLLECRLHRRAVALGLGSLDKYCDFLFQKGGLDGEVINLIDAVTTNKTDFFREPKHFDYLVAKALPALASGSTWTHGPLNLWSAACSTGAEAYTLAMVLAEQKALVPAYAILATDISTKVLKAGMHAVYPDIMADAVPEALRRRYMMRGLRGSSGKVRIVPELRRTVKFERLNLIETPYNGIGRDMHVIFCRNILIYFDRPTQRKVLNQLCHHLAPGGFLFLGHSETLAGFELPVTQVATSIFRARD